MSAPEDHPQTETRYPVTNADLARTACWVAKRAADFAGCTVCEGEPEKHVSQFVLRNFRSSMMELIDRVKPQD